MLARSPRPRTLALMAWYELVELLGEGGMGCVYRAVHHPSGRAVAIKTLHSHLKVDVRRLRMLHDEATAAAKLDDPHIVRLLDLGSEEDGVPFLVMELAEGTALDAMIERWAGWPAIVNALIGALEGLAAAHAHGIVHRDLKPSNVIVSPEGNARVLDFGVAALIDPFEEQSTGMIMGTPEFMPPEQLSGNGAIGPWTDLYAFGVMLAQVIRGESPFASAKSMVTLMMRKQSYVPETKPTAREGLEVPAELQALIEKLLRPHHRARPRFAVEVVEDLLALAPRVIDRVGITGPVETHDSVRPTTVDPDMEDSAAEIAAALERGPPLELPARLPALVADPALGAALSRLRDVPLVGRDEERAQIVSAVDAVVLERAPRLLLYVGEPGIGKSRLARWGLSYVEREGRMEGAAGGYDPGGADFAGGLRHALRRLVGAPGPNPERTWAWLGEPDLSPVELARYLGEQDRKTLLPVEAIIRMSHAALRGVGRMHPIYLWLDDLAWARDGGLQLVQKLLDEGDVPVLIVATVRTGTTEHSMVRERIERLAAHPRAEKHEVTFLDAASRAQLIEEIAPMAPELSQEIAGRMDGSPLLLVQLVHDWLARGLLVASGAMYNTRGGTSIDELIVERPLAALVDDRVDTALGTFGPGPAVEVLGRAALIGARFEHQALRAACASDPRLQAALDGILDHALLVGLLRSDRSGIYTFDHGLIREALVERVETGSDRVSALVDAANGLLSRYGKERADVAGMVADLLYRAGKRERAWERLFHAMDRGAWVADLLGAERHLGVARRWVKDQPERRAEVEHAEARIRFQGLRYHEALAALDRAREAALETTELAAFDATEADVLFYLDRFRESQAIAERCLAKTEDSDDPDLIGIAAQAAHRLADLAGMRGDLEKELVQRLRCLALHQATSNGWRIRVAKLNTAEVMAAYGNIDEAIVYAEEVEAASAGQKDDAFVAASQETRAHILALAGRGAEVRDVLEMRRQTALAAGDRWRLTNATAYCALVAAEIGEPEEMEREARSFIERFREVPHDETATIAALLRLASRLGVRGRHELSREVDGLLDSRIERSRVGFGEDDASEA